MNILSLFDGMSCGQIALNRAAINYNNYFASEIDTHAIKVAQDNYPNTIQLGDVKKVKGSDLPKIDLLIGGSPCQGFSFAGKGLNFKDPRSLLFFEYVRILKECKEKNPEMLFLLENVRMTKDNEDIISRILGIQPININSYLVSAQSRERLYWTNINSQVYGLFDDKYCAIPQPKDRGIFLRDILQPKNEVDDKYYISSKAIERILRKQYSQPRINPEKTGTLNTKNNSGQLSIDSGTTLICDDEAVCVAMRGRNPDNPSDRTAGTPVEQRLEPNTRGKTICLTSVSKDNLIMYNKAGNQLNKLIRRLTPIECERLQTVPDNYTSCVSDSQRYRMLGNGWTIDVITHIYSFI